MLTDSLALSASEILVEWQPAAGRPGVLGVRVVPSLTVVGFGPPAGRPSWADLAVG
jgi:hypothetical protein